VASRASCPAIARSIAAASATVRVMGPTWSIDHASGTSPWRLTRPYVGLTPTTPQSAAGARMEPPVSLPVAPAVRPAARALAEPALDAPLCSDADQGLGVSPKTS
jgi:hypothetical protein